MAHLSNFQHPPPARIPADPGIWFLITGEMLVFSLFFIIFVFGRKHDPSVFLLSQKHLNLTLGVFNTVLMLTSSWFVALGIRAARLNMGRITPILFLTAASCGLGFGIVKYFEYRDGIHAGYTLNTNDFFMYYYIFTGIHMMHVIIGICVLSILARYSWSGAYGEGRIINLESGATFWHMVDLLWIVLFALFYLLK